MPSQQLSLHIINSYQNASPARRAPTAPQAKLSTGGLVSRHKQNNHHFRQSKRLFFLNTYLLPKGKRLLEIIISKSLFAEVSLTPYFCSGVGVQLHKMNLSSALKHFWQAIPEPAKVLEVGKAFPLLGSSASQQV